MEITNVGPESELAGENIDDQSYSFEFLGSKLEGHKDLDKLLTKWGLSAKLSAPYFRFNHRFNDINPEAFLIDLFNSPTIRQHLDFVFLPGGQYTKVGFKKLKCDLINLEVFNKLEDAGIVVPDTKGIKMMLEEEIKGIMVGDKLRECLINEDSDDYCVFNEEERREFLFKLFSSLVLGGAMCQYEDKATEYYERTKELYKSIVSARKDPKTNNIFIESHAFEIQKIENDHIFTGSKDRENPQNFLYVIVSPSLRQVVLYGHKWVPYW